MNYELGLAVLKQAAENSDWSPTFDVLETRLRENLYSERLFGSNSELRSERSRIVSELNALARARLHVSFNDLCLGLAFQVSVSRHGLDGNNKQVTVLFICADPTNTTYLRLGQEFREIQEKLQLAKERHRFKLEPRMSARVGDVSQALLDTRPQIVHFSGHGTSESELVLEDEFGRAHRTPPEALSLLFGLVQEDVKCVVLNACYSEAQARAIAEHVAYVVGMNAALSDNAAIAFSTGFYQALGAGKSIEDAYKFGCAQILLQSIPEHLVPVLMRRE